MGMPLHARDSPCFRATQGGRPPVHFLPVDIHGEIAFVPAIRRPREQRVRFRGYERRRGLCAQGVPAPRHRARPRSRPGSAHGSHPDLVRHSALLPPYVLTHMQPPGSLCRRTHSAHVSERPSRGKQSLGPAETGIAQASAPGRGSLLPAPPSWSRRPGAPATLRRQQSRCVRPRAPVPSAGRSAAGGPGRTASLPRPGPDPARAFEPWRRDRRLSAMERFWGDPTGWWPRHWPVGNSVMDHGH